MRAESDPTRAALTAITVIASESNAIAKTKPTVESRQALIRLPTRRPVRSTWRAQASIATVANR